MKSNRVICIQNGVDFERVNRVLDTLPTQTIHGIDKKFHLIYVARLTALKRQDILLQALRVIPDCEITLIGAGNEREPLHQLALEYGISEKVHFLGIIPRNTVYIQIRSHDLYVSSSSYEGLPISVLEAMSCGVPCVVSDIEQHREIQEKCPSLITVNNTPEDWIKVIRSMIEMSEEERNRIGAQNKRDVDQNFSLERMHQQYDFVYSEVVKEYHER